jgi:ABC-type nitrate/sulfonate/bicarbonate transport system ATPase subunit
MAAGEDSGIIYVPEKAENCGNQSRFFLSRMKTKMQVTHDIDEAIYMSNSIVLMSPRPGRIDHILPVNIPRPRDRSSPEFLRLRGHILELLHFAGH